MFIANTPIFPFCFSAARRPDIVEHFRTYPPPRRLKTRVYMEADSYKRGTPPGFGDVRKRGLIQGAQDVGNDKRFSGVPNVSLENREPLLAVSNLRWNVVLVMRRAGPRVGQDASDVLSRRSPHCPR